jgi:hypothetical protein
MDIINIFYKKYKCGKLLKEFNECSEQNSKSENYEGRKKCLETLNELILLCILEDKDKR